MLLETLILLAVTSQGRKIDDHVVVGTVPSDFMSSDHACGVLSRAKISSFSGGSRAYGVFVSPTDKQRAIQLLAADAKLYPHIYIFVGKEKIVQPVIQRETLTFGSPLKATLEDPRVKADGNLRGAIRKGSEYMSDHWKGRAAQTVEKVEAEPRPYVNAKGKRMDGYYMKVYFSWPGGAAYCYLAVFDEGKQTRLFGGGSYGP